MNALRAYARTQQETASRERLMILLFQTALRHVRTGAESLEQGKQATDLLIKASDIVMELHGTLDRAQNPELCDSLAASYEFVAQRLLRALASRDANAAREAERVLAPIVEAFEQAVASLPAEGAR